MCFFSNNVSEIAHVEDMLFYVLGSGYICGYSNILQDDSVFLYMRDDTLFDSQL